MAGYLVRGRAPVLLLGLGLLLGGCGGERGPVETGPLTVFNAGSLARPFHDLLAAFAAAHPGVTVAQENAGSLETARKLTELGRIPDIVGVADYQIMPTLLVPAHASWYALFATNSMVLLHSRGARGADRINADNWWQVLLQPEVRVGHANPRLDPNGYRTLMVFQLAEEYYREPGLAARLNAAVPDRYIRPKESDLTALVESGELDYAFSYASIARATGLPMVTLPTALDLSDPAQADFYAHAVVRLPGSGGDTLTFRGEPITYALTIPDSAAHPALARQFVDFVFSDSGQAILRAAGLTPITPEIRGSGGPDGDAPRRQASIILH